MRRALLVALLVAVSLPASAAPDPSRDVLWAALKTCVLAKRIANRTFPCLSVDLGDTERPGSAVCVLGDRAQLERVMINLLSNAVKFTEDGGTIGFSVGIEDDHAIITVRDTGIGIPTNEQGDLFQRFFRSSTAQVRQIQGTGLGLSIVAAIVSGHGGTIDVQSDHMQGSTFTVKLPLSDSDRLTPAG